MCLSECFCREELEEKVALKKIEGVFEHITIAKVPWAVFEPS